MCQIIVIICCFVFSLVKISYGNICQSSDGIVGACIHLSKCSGNYTRQNVCGSSDNNRVCCLKIKLNFNADQSIGIDNKRIKKSVNQNVADDNCRSNLGIDGLCVRSSECSITKNNLLTRTQFRYIRNNQCFNNKKYICCPTNDIISNQAAIKNRTLISCSLQNGTCKPLRACSKNQIIGNVTNCQKRQVCCQKSLFSLRKTIENKLELLPKDCGLDYTTGTRIYHGKDTNIAEHTWMALLVNKRPTARSSKTLLEYRCGGFLINKQYVISAAHCVHNIQQQFYAIRLGEWDYNSNVDCYVDCSTDPIDIEIQKVIIQPNYTTNSIKNDIALIRLNKTVKFSRFIQPICLPTAEYLKNEIYDGTLLEIAGWGKTQDGEVSSRKLKASVSGMTNQNCKKFYKSKIFSWGQMCAGGNNNRNTCRGDSGGPLMYFDRNATYPRWVAVGISAAGPEECGIGNLPSIYTRVVTQLDWILNNIQL